MSEMRYTIHISSNNRSIVSIDNYVVIPNEITFLFGESGIGKSIISKAIYGLLDQDELHVEINNKPYNNHLQQPWTRGIQKNSFFVFQEPSSHLNSLLKITEQLSEGSLRSCKNERDILHHLWQTTDDESIRKILDIYPKPYRPSGGEKQRVLLAMAFKKINILLQLAETDKPTYFVFDEPTGSLDDNYRNLFLDLLFQKYCQRPFTSVLITHDYSIISEIYNKYKHILDRIHFKELTRRNENRVFLDDFSADEYLTWLHKTGEAGPGKSSIGDKEVLHVGSNFRIFNRSLCIFRDEAHTTPKDLSIGKGEMVYMKAPSGVGKTTLAKIVMGLYDAQKLSMNLCGMTVTERTDKKFWQKRIWGKKAGMVFQHADESLNLRATVREIFAGLPTKRKLTIDILKLKLMELFENEISEAFLNKQVAFLSGGQKQRLNLLRTLIMETDLVILDEPLNGLDFISIKKILHILEEKRREGSSLLMISHNEEIFDNLIDRQHVYYLS